MGDERIVVKSIGDLELEPDLIAEGQILEGSPIASEHTIGQWTNGTTTGVWRCEAGHFTDVELDETFVVIEGQATIRHGDEVHEVGPGDICVLPVGAKTEWTVHESILKVYVADTQD